jgi:hypothetical protein
MKTIHPQFEESQGQPNVMKTYVFEPTCEKCDGTGIMTVPNGEDDYDHDFCTCPVGEHAEHIASNELQAHGN